MAGTRQHVLPRFLIRGFASRTERNQTYCWVFRKDSEPFETNIGNVAVAKSFYTGAGDTDADDLITGAEGRFSATVRQLRELGKTSKIEDETVPELIAHFEIRTRHVRETLLDATNTFMHELLEYFKNTELIETMVLKRFREDPLILKRALAKELKKQGVSMSPAQKNLLASLMQDKVPQLMRNLEPQLQVLAQVFARQLSKQLPKAAKDGHLKTLKESVAPPPKVEKYRGLYFKLVISTDDVILGDNGVLFEVEGKGKFKTFLVGEDSVSTVYLPISRDRFVVGINTWESEVLPAEALNRAIAEHSREFFVSSQNRPDLGALKHLIGTRSRILSDQEIEQITAQLVEKELKGNKPSR